MNSGAMDFQDKTKPNWPCELRYRPDLDAMLSRSMIGHPADFELPPLKGGGPASGGVLGKREQKGAKAVRVGHHHAHKKASME